MYGGVLLSDSYVSDHIDLKKEDIIEGPTIGGFSIVFPYPDKFPQFCCDSRERKRVSITKEIKFSNKSV